jgi:7-cyano-7-deazaguanine synthase
MHSGGADSLAIMLEYIEKYGNNNIVSLGFNYGQRHFKMENDAAIRFCTDYGIERIALDIPLGQIGGCCLTDHSIEVTTDMNQQRSTVVPMRNSIFLMLAAAVAQVRGCDIIVHGACKEDQAAYRDCRKIFFDHIQLAIQAGLTDPKRGSEYIENDIYDGLLSNHKIDIKIETPLIRESKEETMARILTKYPVDIYKYSYSCYNGRKISCGVCPACRERLAAFGSNHVTDPLVYMDKNLN